jgi:hypothetical protein
VDKASQAGPVGAGAFHANALHRSEVFGPGDQGDIAAGRGRERLGVEQPPGLVDDRGHVGVQVGVDPDRDRALWCWHAFHDRSFRLIGQGRHAPIGTVDSTAMGPLARLLSGHSARPVGAFSVPRQLADRSNSRHQAGEASGQTSHRGHDPDHRSEEFLYELKAGPAGGRLRRPSSRRQRHDGHRGAGLTVQRSRHRYRTLIGTLSSPGFGHAKEKAPAAAGSDGTLSGLGARQSVGVSVDSNGACRGGSGGAAGRGASRWPSRSAWRSPAGRPGAARGGSPGGIPRAATTRIESTR